jgi:hypothetical protein
MIPSQEELRTLSDEAAAHVLSMEGTQSGTRTGWLMITTIFFRARDYQLADFGRRLLDESGIDEPIDGLFIFLEAKGKKRAIQAMRKARYADRIARLTEPASNKLQPPPALPDSNNGAASSAKRRRARARQRSPRPT